MYAVNIILTTRLALRPWSNAVAYNRRFGPTSGGHLQCYDLRKATGKEHDTVETGEEHVIVETGEEHANYFSQVVTVKTASTR